MVKKCLKNFLSVKKNMIYFYSNSTLETGFEIEIINIEDQTIYKKIVFDEHDLNKMLLVQVNIN
jgi:hypothetical protein